MAACYMDCNYSVNPTVTVPVTTALLNRGNIEWMTKTKQGQHFIQGWRSKRGISLRKLASMLPTGSDGKEMLTYASLSRIERGEQAFTEPVLNAIAEALNVPRAMLLETDPKKEGHILDLINQMDQRTRDQAIRMIELLAQSTAA